MHLLNVCSSINLSQSMLHYNVPGFLDGDAAPIKGSVVYLLLAIYHAFWHVVVFHNLQLLFVLV